MFTRILRFRLAVGSFCRCYASVFLWWWSTTSSSTLHCPHCQLNLEPQQVGCSGLSIRTRWSLRVYFSPLVRSVTSSGVKVSFNSEWLHLWAVRCGRRLRNPLRHSSSRAVQWELVQQQFSLQRSPSSLTSFVTQWNGPRQLVCGLQCRVWPLPLGQSRVGYFLNTSIGGRYFSSTCPLVSLR